VDKLMGIETVMEIESIEIGKW